MASAKVGKNGDIAIPKSILNSLNLKPGDMLLFCERQGRIFIEKAAPVVLVETFYGALAEQAGIVCETNVERLVAEIGRRRDEAS